MPTDRPPRGRPPLERGAPSVKVSLRVGQSQYDRLEHRAQAQRVNVPEFIRRHLADEDDESDE